jgi:small conductance mechanosensitive channel
MPASLDGVLAKGTDWMATLLDVPLKLALILVTALVIRWVVRRVINRIATGIASGRGGLAKLDDRLPNATAILSPSPLLSARREQRARTTASVLNSATTAAVSAVAILTALPLLGVTIAPLLASAGVIGVALGLGAQALIKDLLAGIFMIAEDQFGVGDVVDLGEATGTVESVGLRVTRLRDADGTLWYLRNGEVLRVGNRSQGWARAVLDVGFPPGHDLVRARDLLLDVARGLVKEEDFAAVVLEEPQVWGVESVSTDSVALRLVVKTQPLQQWTVARELRRRIVERFGQEGLGVPVGLESPTTKDLKPAT